jgi:hypothetical protein
MQRETIPDTKNVNRAIKTNLITIKMNIQRKRNTKPQKDSCMTRLQFDGFSSNQIHKGFFLLNILAFYYNNIVFFIQVSMVAVIKSRPEDS